MTENSAHTNPTSSFNYRVYYEHTDSGGVVYHSRYLNFFERGRTDWLRERNIVQSDLQQDHNIVYAVTTANLSFKKPARMDDALTVTCQMTKIKRASVEFYQEMYNQHKVLLATVYIKAACLKADTFTVMALPKQLKEDLIK
jgi:acyl-CoA thioester hydrolase